MLVKKDLNPENPKLFNFQIIYILFYYYYYKYSQNKHSWVWKLDKTDLSDWLNRNLLIKIVLIYLKIIFKIKLFWIELNHLNYPIELDKKLSLI